MAAAAVPSDDVVKLAKSDFARLLYPNPVCLLATVRDDGLANLMTISWLTCVENSGLVFLSVNAKRASASAILSTGKFTLSVATTGMESMLIRVGSCHGPRDETPKHEHLGVDLCDPGWGGPWGGGGAQAAEATGMSCRDDDSGPHALSPSESAVKQHAFGVPAAVCAAAHLCLRVESVDTKAGHHCILARITNAWVRRRLWKGRTYSLPSESGFSILTFLGSRRFGSLVAANEPEAPEWDAGARRKPKKA